MSVKKKNKCLPEKSPKKLFYISYNSSRFVALINFEFEIIKKKNLSNVNHGKYCVL